VKRRVLGLALLAGALCDMFAWAPWLHGFSAGMVLVAGVALLFVASDRKLERFDVKRAFERNRAAVEKVCSDSYEAGYLRALRDMRAALFTDH
jgi:uncharacterized protein (DUF58 family)